jgi:hypothetical protein
MSGVEARGYISAGRGVSAPVRIRVTSSEEIGVYLE